MGDVINLRRERKRRSKASEADRAAASRITHGLTKAEKQSTRTENAASGRRLDGHRLRPDAAADEPSRDT